MVYLLIPHCLHYIYRKSICNPFHHIDAFWRLGSWKLFENIATLEKIAQNKQFFLLPQCFPLLVIDYQYNYRDFLYFDKICSKSSAAELSHERKGLTKTTLLKIKQSVVEIFHIFAWICSKSSPADLLYVGKGLIWKHSDKRRNCSFCHNAFKMCLL